MLRVAFDQSPLIAFSFSFFNSSIIFLSISCSTMFTFTGVWLRDFFFWICQCIYSFSIILFSLISFLQQWTVAIKFLNQGLFFLIYTCQIVLFFRFRQIFQQVYIMTLFHNCVDFQNKNCLFLLLRVEIFFSYFSFSLQVFKFCRQLTKFCMFVRC